MRALLFGLPMMALVAAPLPSLAADAANGEILAKRWCTGCHVVSEAQAKGTDIAPSFAAIASRPGSSCVRARFGRSDARVELRQVVRPAPGGTANSQLLPSHGTGTRFRENLRRYCLDG